MLEEPLLFTGWSSIQFFNSPLPQTQSVRPPHCVALVWLTERHAMLLVTKCFLPNPS